MEKSMRSAYFVFLSWAIRAFLGALVSNTGQGGGADAGSCALRCQPT